MSTQKHPNNAPAASPSANTAEPSLNRRILALAVPAFGALIAEPIFVLTDSA
ncbi:MAG: MATE family efflux transporter, partial [Rothia mucilaginosa]